MIHSLLTFIIASGIACTSFACHCIDLIKEYNARCILFCLEEELSDPRGTDADIELNELGTREGDEGNARLTFS